MTMVNRGAVQALDHVWDVNLLEWVPEQQPILNAGSVTISGTINQGTGGSSAWKVDGSAVTQPVSGTVAVSNFPASQAVTGAFYQATQPVSGTFYPATQPVSIASMPSTPVTGTFFQATQPVSGTVSVSNMIPAVETGLATATKQDTANTSLASIDGKLTNPLPVSGTVTTGGLTDTELRATAVPVSQATATNLKTQAESYQGGTAVGAANPLQVSLANTGANATPVKVDGSAVTQPISGSVSALVAGTVSVSNMIPAVETGLATSARQDTCNTSLGTIATNSGLAATAAKQDTGNTSLGTIKTNTDPLVTAGAGGYIRQDSTATMAKESGGNLATVKTNTDPFVVAAAGGYVRQDSTGTIAKESGGNLATIATNSALAATAGKQDTGNASLASIDGKITAVNTGAVVVSSSALPTNAATETGNLAALAAVDFALESDGNLETIANNTTDIADTQIVMLACLRELKLLRQSFQDWTGLGEPRYDAEIRIQ